LKTNSFAVARETIVLKSLLNVVFVYAIKFVNAVFIQRSSVRSVLPRSLITSRPRRTE